MTDDGCYVIKGVFALQGRNASVIRRRWYKAWKKPWKKHFTLQGGNNGYYVYLIHIRFLKG